MPADVHSPTVDDLKILVVTPTLGRSRWLAETIRSVHAHAAGARHVLVAPAEVATELREQFPDVTVLPEAGGGMYAAINQGAGAIDAWDLVTYLNDDDLLLPAFSHLLHRARRSAATVSEEVYYGGVRLINGAGRRLGAIPISPSPRLNRHLYAQRLEPIYQHGTVFTRRAWNRLGGFDVAFRTCGDSDLLARACLAGIPMIRVRGAVAAFRLHPGQLTKQRSVMDAERRAVDAKLGLLASRRTVIHRFARLVFRSANLLVYAERIARHGFVSFDQLLTRDS